VTSLPFRPLSLILALSALVWTADQAAADACALDRADLRGSWGQATIQVELAQTSQERAVGLMLREDLAPLHGMLFLYEKPQPVSFWMKDTLIPLDMLFLTPDGRITHIHENAVPLDQTPIAGGDGIQAVLEINGGLARQFGITEGTELRHPSMPQDRAAWPCALQD